MLRMQFGVDAGLDARAFEIIVPKGLVIVFLAQESITFMDFVEMYFP